MRAIQSHEQVRKGLPTLGHAASASPLVRIDVEDYKDEDVHVSTPKLTPRDAPTGMKGSYSEPRLDKSLPVAPQLSRFKSTVSSNTNSRMMMKKRNKKKTAKMKKGWPKLQPLENPAAHLSPRDYVDLDPKTEESPYHPTKVRHFLNRPLANPSMGMSAKSTVMEEYENLTKRASFFLVDLAFDGKNPAQGRVGGGTSGVSARATPSSDASHEDIERAEGCDYYRKDALELQLLRRLRWRSVKADVEGQISAPSTAELLSPPKEGLPGRNSPNVKYWTRACTSMIRAFLGAATIR